MKKLLLALLGSVAIVSGAQAADVAENVFTPVSVYDWSGAYVGVFAAGVWGKSHAFGFGVDFRTGLGE